MKFQLLFCFTFIVISSCIQEVDFDVPASIVKVGINCILVNNEVLEVVVYLTCSIQDSLEINYITDAEVNLVRSDGFKYEFELSNDSAIYLSDVPALHNYSYSLEVNYNGQIYAASTTIPGAIDDLKAEYDHGKFFDEYGEDLTHMVIRIVDDPNEANYYQMFILDPSYTDPKWIYNFWTFHNISDPILIAESLLEYEPLGFIFSDTYSDDGRIQIELLGSLPLHNGMPSETEIIVRSISKEYFNFLRSWIIHYYNQNNPEHVNVIDDLDPYRIFFQEQPVPLYSNIKGGTGIFVGYNETRTTFKYVD